MIFCKCWIINQFFKETVLFDCCGASCSIAWRGSIFYTINGTLTLLRSLLQMLDGFGRQVDRDRSGNRLINGLAFGC